MKCVNVRARSLRFFIHKISARTISGNKFDEIRRTKQKKNLESAKFVNAKMMMLRMMRMTSAIGVGIARYRRRIANRIVCVAFGNHMLLHPIVIAIGFLVVVRVAIYRVVVVWPSTK